MSMTCVLVDWATQRVLQHLAWGLWVFTSSSVTESSVTTIKAHYS